jgi:hypothetical protein
MEILTGVELVIYEIIFVLVVVSHVQVMLTDAGSIPKGKTTYDRSLMQHHDILILDFLELKEDAEARQDTDRAFVGVPKS